MVADYDGPIEPGWSLEKTNTQLRVSSPGVFRSTLLRIIRLQMQRTISNFKLAAAPAAGGVSQLAHRVQRSISFAPGNRWAGPFDRVRQSCESYLGACHCART